MAADVVVAFFARIVAAGVVVVVVLMLLILLLIVLPLMLLFLLVLIGVDTLVAGIAAVAFFGCGVLLVLAVLGLDVVVDRRRRSRKGWE